MVNGLRDVYVLGAGASAVHGAPVTDRILPYAFEHLGGDARLGPVRDVLLDLFAVDPTAALESEYPSLVDVLSVVDMAIDRADHLAAGYGDERLRAIRRALEYAILGSLEEALLSSDSSSPATQDLAAWLTPRSAVISLNYDVIIDRAIAYRDESDPYGEVLRGLREERGPRMIDYGVEFANVPETLGFPRPTGAGDSRGPDVEPAGAGPADQRVPLLKLHGSFNWLESGVTGDLYYGGLTKSVRFLFEAADDVDVPDLHAGRHAWMSLPKAELRPVMITPTHMKDLRDPHVARVWRAAESVLWRADSVAFIGYSLPGDDIHVKYLFKRALSTRPDGSRPRIVVVNPDAAAVENYERFFGRIDDHHADFEEFAAGLSGRAG